jgi:hypothetical protein
VASEPTKNEGQASDELPDSDEFWSPDLDKVPPEAKFLFAGLDDEEILDRLVAYQLWPASEHPFKKLDRLLKDTSPPEPREPPEHRKIIDFLLQLLRKECAGERGAVAEHAASIVGDRLDALRAGETLGQQRAALRFRHPNSRLQLPAHERWDARKLRSSRDLFLGVRVLREFREVVRKIALVVPRSKRVRKQSAATVRAKLVELFPPEQYPRLHGVMDHDLDVENVTPDRAARLAFGDRWGIDEKTVSDRLAIARDDLRFMRDVANRRLG